MIFSPGTDRVKDTRNMGSCNKNVSFDCSGSKYFFASKSHCNDLQLPIHLIYSKYCYSIVCENFDMFLIYMITTTQQNSL